MAQVETDDPTSYQKNESPKKGNGLDNGSPESPLKPLLDTDVAFLLSKDSPKKSDGIVANDSCEEKDVLIHDLNVSNVNSTQSTDPSNGNVQQNPVLNESSSLRASPEKNGASDQTNSDLNDTEGCEPCNENGFEVNKIPNNYRLTEYQSSEDEDDSSECSDLSSDCSDSFLYELRKNVKAPSSAPKSKEFKLPEQPIVDDLPAIEDLKITVKESELEKVGYIGGFVDMEVVVHALEGLKPLQLDSVLFLSNDKPLGHVSDVYGPVKKPYYSVRFNSKDHMEKIGVKIGMNVFYAPEKTEITQYVFPEELQKEKGSDASGKNDNEPSDDNLDYSDDEKEREARQRRKKKRREALMNLNGTDSTQEATISIISERTNYQRNNQRGGPTNHPPNNPFYSLNNNNNNSRPMYDGPTWQKPLLQKPHFQSPVCKLSPKSDFINTPQRYQNPFGAISNGSQFTSHAPQQAYTQQTPPANYRLNLPFQPPQSSFQFQPSQQNMYQHSPLPPSQQQRQNTYSYPPPSPLPFQHHSQFVQHSARVGPPRPISFQQSHMFGQMTPLGSPAAHHFSYTPGMSPAPMVSTNIPPPASPNFSYFSHPFPSAPSPGPSQQSYYQSPPSPGVQVMSPLSIQIPGNMRSPPPPVATGFRINHNLLQQQQQNEGAYRPQQRF